MRIDTVGIRSMIARAAAAAALLAMATGTASAGTGAPSPWQMDFQGMVTETGRGVADFHYWLLWIITAISLFVLVLIVAIVIRFNERRNPVPARTTHNTLLEVAWTIVPVLILIGIAIPSFRILREQLVIPPHDIVVKATGNSWYWNYEYPADQGGFRFDSNMVEEKDLKAGQPRLLTVDNEMVVPIGKVVRLQVTAADVMHNFAVPSLGQRLDAIPGRLNETWFRADQEGVYYGQCSELCGNGHPYMPIAVRVVSEQQYEAWLAEAKQKFAAAGTATQLAEAR
jgi:cytochrome c oxidase subunit II